MLRWPVTSTATVEAATCLPPARRVAVRLLLSPGLEPRGAVTTMVKSAVSPGLSVSVALPCL